MQQFFIYGPPRISLHVHVLQCRKRKWLSVGGKPLAGVRCAPISPSARVMCFFKRVLLLPLCASRISPRTAGGLDIQNRSTYCTWHEWVVIERVWGVLWRRETFMRPSNLLCSEPCMCCTCTRFLLDSLSLSRSRALPFSLSHFRFFSRSLSRWTSFSRAHTYTHVCTRTLNVGTCIHTRSYCFLPLEASPVHLPANRCGNL